MAKRKKVDNKLFLKLCREGKSNEQIAAGMGWKAPKNSKDRFHRVRAQKSIARTKGLMVDGKRVFWKEGKKKAQAKAKKKIHSKSKSEPKPKPEPKPKAEPKQQVPEPEPEAEARKKG